MNRTARLYRLRSLLGKHHVASAKDLMEKLGVSRSSLTRYLHELEDTLAVPVYFDREAGGYRLAADDKQELAGLWFSPEEIHALLTMQHLLTTLDSGGLLGPHIAPLKQRLTRLLGAADDSALEITRRVFIETVGARRVRSEHFQTVGSALLRRKRLRIGMKLPLTPALSPTTRRGSPKDAVVDVPAAKGGGFNRSMQRVVESARPAPGSRGSSVDVR